MGQVGEDGRPSIFSTELVRDSNELRAERGDSVVQEEPDPASAFRSRCLPWRRPRHQDFPRWQEAASSSTSAVTAERAPLLLTEEVEEALPEPTDEVPVPAVRAVPVGASARQLARRLPKRLWAADAGAGAGTEKARSFAAAVMSGAWALWVAAYWTVMLLHSPEHARDLLSCIYRHGIFLATVAMAWGICSYRQVCHQHPEPAEDAFHEGGFAATFRHRVRLLVSSWGRKTYQRLDPSHFDDPAAGTETGAGAGWLKSQARLLWQRSFSQQALCIFFLDRCLRLLDMASDVVVTFCHTSMPWCPQDGFWWSENWWWGHLSLFLILNTFAMECILMAPIFLKQMRRAHLSAPISLLMWLLVGPFAAAILDALMLFRYPCREPRVGWLGSAVRLQQVAASLVQAPAQLVLQCCLLAKGFTWPRMLLLSAGSSLLSITWLFLNIAELADAQRRPLGDSLKEVLLLGLERDAPLLLMMYLRAEVSYEFEGPLTTSQCKHIAAVASSCPRNLTRLTFGDDNQLGPESFSLLLAAAPRSLQMDTRSVYYDGATGSLTLRAAFRPYLQALMEVQHALWHLRALTVCHDEGRQEAEEPFPSELCEQIAELVRPLENLRVLRFGRRATFTSRPLHALLMVALAPRHCRLSNLEIRGRNVSVLTTLVPMSAQEVGEFIQVCQILDVIASSKAGGSVVTPLVKVGDNVMMYRLPGGSYEGRGRHLVIQSPGDLRPPVLELLRQVQQLCILEFGHDDAVEVTEELCGRIAELARSLEHLHLLKFSKGTVLSSAALGVLLRVGFAPQHGRATALHVHGEECPAGELGEFVLASQALDDIAGGKAKQPEVEIRAGTLMYTLPGLSYEARQRHLIVYQIYDVQPETWARLGQLRHLRTLECGVGQECPMSVELCLQIAELLHSLESLRILRLGSGAVMHHKALRILLLAVLTFEKAGMLDLEIAGQLHLQGVKQHLVVQPSPLLGATDVGCFLIAIQVLAAIFEESRSFRVTPAIVDEISNDTMNYQLAGRASYFGREHKLEIENNADIGPEGCFLLKEIRNIRDLTIGLKSSIGANGCRHIADMRLLSSLTILSGNDIRNEGCRHLKKLQLTSLLIGSGNNIGPDGCQHLSKVRTLQRLTIEARNNIGASGCHCLLSLPELRIFRVDRPHNNLESRKAAVCLGEMRSRGIHVIISGVQAPETP